MSEETKQYGKTITATEMMRVGASYGHQKNMENAHKDNLLGRDFDNLKGRLEDEIDEFKKALIMWRSSRTERNAESFRREGGDIINIVSAMMAKTAGYNVLIRE